MKQFGGLPLLAKGKWPELATARVDFEACPYAQ
jgi:hypothetical protein